MAKQTKLIMVALIFPGSSYHKMIIITNVDISHNHTILHASHDNSNPLYIISIQTHLKVYTSLIYTVKTMYIST